MTRNMPTATITKSADMYMPNELSKRNAMQKPLMPANMTITASSSINVNAL